MERSVMGSYSPLKITGFSGGLVQEREEFILPDDAYPTLQNAYVWRERIIRKSGYQLLGRLQRNIGITDGAGNFSVAIAPLPIQPGIASFVIGTDIFNDPGGASPVTLLTNSSGTGTLNRATGVITITGSKVTTAVQYFPGLPVMGIRTRELQNSADDQTVFFDQDYAYVFNGATSQFQEFIPGITWNAHAGDVSATDFFWSTNYWVSSTVIPGTVTPLFTTTNRKLFWVTNNTGEFGAQADPPRITDGVTWVDFFPSVWSQIDATTFLTNFLSMLPYRGRMVTFNTWEGPTAASSQNFSNRIRWSTIGNPFIPYTAGPPAKGSWRDDIRGQGGYLDIPTSEDIIAVGFVRDNLVIYCERSTWQLRYTGRSIAPFQIERVNSELGAEGPFSAVQFDTSLVGLGDKGVVECDSYKSERIDIKIPDFVFQFNTLNDGVFRVHGIRDFPNRLAYWTIPYARSYDGAVPSTSWIFPNQRLVYNYENDSWALFNDSLTTLGTYQAQTSRNWVNTHQPWVNCHFPWVNQPQGDPVIVGGNQQGFIEQLDELNTNDVSLFISNITQGTTVIITSPNHNMQTGFVIGISGIPTGTPFSSLNGGIFGIVLGDDTDSDTANKFRISTYNSTLDAFDTVVTGTPPGTYVGGGLINIRENFSIISKKFNFLDEGQSIQLGYIDILMSASGTNNPGAISLNIYLDYDDINASNILPKNEINGVSPPTPDTFFNSIIPTTPSTLASAPQGTKFWHRVFCATRANFLTLQYKFSNAQIAGEEQKNDVQIDAQVLWIRQAGRMTSL
jgi:hypothetical protein